MRLLTRGSALVTAAMLATPALAQYTSDFEGLSASASGTVLTGQDSYYIPMGTNSIDFDAFTYAGNSLGIPANPNGGAQFISGTGPASPTFARAQRDMSYGAGTGTWRFGFDICATFTGMLPSAQNLGSFSVQPFPGSQSFIALARWTDPATATNWNADYVWYDGAGNQLLEPVADPGFQNLAVDHWYRWETDVSLDTNQILEVRVIDLTSGTVASHNPVDRYMEGGTMGSATPTGFRFFAGGGVDGNTLAFDNPSIDEFTPPCSNLEIGGMGKALDFQLTGAAPEAPAILLLARYQGTTVHRFGVLGTLELGLSQPILPTMMGLTDSNGDVSLMVHLPPGMPPVHEYAQALTVVFNAPPPGPPSLEFCVSDVEEVNGM